jgi:hypothetical protein
MNNGEDHGLIRLNAIVHRIRKAPHQRFPYVVMNLRVKVGIGSNLGQDAIYLIDEVRTQPGLLLLIPVGGIIELPLGDTPRPAYSFLHPSKSRIAHLFPGGRHPGGWPGGPPDAGQVPRATHR